MPDQQNTPGYRPRRERQVLPSSLAETISKLHRSSAETSRFTLTHYLPYRIWANYSDRSVLYWGHAYQKYAREIAEDVWEGCDIPCTIVHTFSYLLGPNTKLRISVYYIGATETDNPEDGEDEDDEPECDHRDLRKCQATGCPVGDLESADYDPGPSYMDGVSNNA